MTVKELFEASKKLSYAERSELARLLLDELDPPEKEMSKDEFIAELDRRAKELEENPELGIPCDEVFARAEQFLVDKGLR